MTRTRAAGIAIAAGAVGYRLGRPTLLEKGFAELNAYNRGLFRGTRIASDAYASRLANVSQSRRLFGRRGRGK